MVQRKFRDSLETNRQFTVQRNLETVERLKDNSETFEDRD